LELDPIKISELVPFGGDYQAIRPAGGFQPTVTEGNSTGEQNTARLNKSAGSNIRNWAPHCRRRSEILICRDSRTSAVFGLNATRTATAFSPIEVSALNFATIRKDSSSFTSTVAPTVLNFLPNCLAA
jgi:hypothetical protein